MTINDSFVQHIRKLAQSVVDFHERFGAQHTDNMENLKFRNQLLTEEVGEVAKALNHNAYADAVLESVDVAYVALGTLLAHAPESFIGIMEVIEKNVAKTPETHQLQEGQKVVPRAEKHSNLCLYRDCTG